MRIRNIFKRLFPTLHLTVWMMVAGVCACTTDAFEGVQEEPEAPVFYTYSMHLKGTIEDYGKGTRAGYQWNDGSKLYVQFFENGDRISGTATFNLADDMWTVKTSKALTAPDDAHCEAYYFVNPSAALSTTVTLDLKSITYADKAGKYILEEDDAIAVTATLSPLTGRIRFVGTPGAEYTISGLMTYTGYSVNTNAFTHSSRKLTVKIDDNGSSDYFYALFEDARQLVIYGEGKSAYSRTFADHVLTAGNSGFVTLPMGDDLGKWTLVNVDNLEEITMPEVSKVTVSTIRSKSAGVTANVTSKGNGTLFESGILCSANSTPTLENSTKYDAGKSISISLRVKNLTPMSTYYVRAYARNERGTVYGEVAEFTTLSDENEGPSFSIDDYDKEEDEDNLDSSTGEGDSKFNRDEHGEEDDLDSSADSSGSNFGKEEHEEDDDLNSKTDGNSSFGKEEHEEDDDLNSKTDGGSSFGKEEHEEDDDLNSKTDGNSNFGKEEHEEDDDLNSKADGDSNFGKEEHEDDDDLNTKTDTDGSSFGKEGYKEDDDLNSKPQTNGNINNGGYNDDEDWNSNPDADGSLGKGDYDSDEDWNSNTDPDTDGSLGKGDYDSDEDWN